MNNCKRPNRAMRLKRLLKTGWHTAWGITHGCNTTTASKVVSELRASGVRVLTRRNSEGLNEYRVR